MKGVRLIEKGDMIYSRRYLQSLIEESSKVYVASKALRRCSPMKPVPGGKSTSSGTAQ